MTQEVRSNQQKATPESSGRLFKILSHPLRHRILVTLNEMEEGSPTQLAGRLGEPVGNVSYHVKVLAEADAIELVRTEPRRGALEHFYRPVTRAEIDEEHWSQLPASIRRRIFDSSLQEIWDHMVEARGTDGFDHERAHISWAPLKLDDQGFEAVGAVLLETMARLHEIEDQAVARADGSGDGLSETEVAILHYQRD